jgi:hypothetical protein
LIFFSPFSLKQGNLCSRVSCSSNKASCSSVNRMVNCWG